MPIITQKGRRGKWRLTIVSLSQYIQTDVMLLGGGLWYVKDVYCKT